MKYDNNFKIGFIRCKCGKSLIIKKKSFLNILKESVSIVALKLESEELKKKS